MIHFIIVNTYATLPDNVQLMSRIVEYTTQTGTDHSVPIPNKAGVVMLDTLSAAGHRPSIVHAANSAGAIMHPRARYSMVRPGIAAYGLSPGAGVDATARELDLRPALSLRARVSFVKRLSAGARISYGLRHTFTRDTTVATVPIGYADGVPRRLPAVGGEVLIGGVRRPIVGVVTMDQLMAAGSRSHHRHRVGIAARHHRLRGGVRDLVPRGAPGRVTAL